MGFLLGLILGSVVMYFAHAKVAAKIDEWRSR